MACDRIFGCAKRHVRIFTRDHIARIQTFSEQAAVALQNAQLYDALRQRADNLEVHVEQRTTSYGRSKSGRSHLE